jgi:hypothetical protein
METEPGYALEDAFFHMILLIMKNVNKGSLISVRILSTLKLLKVPVDYNSLDPYL